MRKTICRYHKPGCREESDYSGLAWLGSAHTWSGRCTTWPPLTALPLFRLDPDDPGLLKVCADCEYRVDGCDFRNPAVDSADGAPCGGLRAVAEHLTAGRDLGL
ncbi:conserved hypothetical protein [Desulfarculales bacterium]